VSALLLYGANVHSDLALRKAIEHGHPEIVRLLLEEYSADEDIHDVDRRSGQMFLHVLAASPIRDTDVIDLIMGYGTNVNAEDKSGSTPLHEAAQTGNVMMVKKLLEHGATMHIQNHKGRTPLDVAKRNGKSAVVECLGGKKSWWRR
jgi:ankyrin repeat protein